MLKKNAEIELRIEKVAFGGKGVARYDGMVLFVERALPGDHVRARIRKVKRNFAEAYPVELLQPSPLRIEAPCRHFGYCGGCKWQNVDYQQQLRFKQHIVAESLAHIGGLRELKVEATLPSPKVFHYRNKMEFSFTGRRWLTPEELDNPQIEKGFALGLHTPGAFDRIIQIDYCWLQSETLNQILRFATSYFRESGLPVYHLRTHEGLLRFLVLRESAARGEVMVNVVTSRPAREELADFASQLRNRFPVVASVVNGVNARPAQIAYSDQVLVLAGKDHIEEQLDECIFKISPNSFFQTNSHQAVQLYRLVRDLAEVEGERVWDLYSGIGSIAIFLARQAREVVGFELVESAVQDAFENARIKGTANCRFVAGDLKDTLQAHLSEAPEVVVCDPPRAGMHEQVVRMILKANPRRIVYVSCNPTTLARDLAYFSSHYRVERVHPVDMFPHTYHVETVVKLDRRCAN
ncbi:MAG: 23S rRNA (uracil(1939)-C(5))-methyltransferase RlmD [Calditrichaeota bacterium]|nr:MAG: 23S rRNA (uracil(1939)-C(5))-methyltransferase RlmD [Calditrichota bacterium]